EGKRLQNRKALLRIRQGTCQINSLRRRNMLARVIGSMAISLAMIGGCFTGPAAAIDVKLDEAAIRKAVYEGKQIKDVKSVPTQFGTDLSKDLCCAGGESQTTSI